MGSAEKIYAHQQGLLHLAFSIIVVDCITNPTKTFIHQRQSTKYHSPGLWSNACCGHPLPQENMHTAAQRRLSEELCIHEMVLTPLETTVYCLDVGNGLTEHEWNQVFISEIPVTDPITPNPDEISQCRWVDLEDLYGDIITNPGRYSAWLPYVLGCLKTTAC